MGAMTTPGTTNGYHPRATASLPPFLSIRIAAIESESESRGLALEYFMLIVWSPKYVLQNFSLLFLLY
jgi:hypothetical protein